MVLARFPPQARSLLQLALLASVQGWLPGLELALGLGLALAPVQPDRLLVAALQVGASLSLPRLVEVGAEVQAQEPFPAQQHPVVVREPAQHLLPVAKRGAEATARQRWFQLPVALSVLAVLSARAWSPERLAKRIPLQL